MNAGVSGVVFCTTNACGMRYTHTCDQFCNHGPLNLVIDIVVELATASVQLMLWTCCFVNTLVCQVSAALDIHSTSRHTTRLCPLFVYRTFVAFKACVSHKQLLAKYHFIPLLWRITLTSSFTVLYIKLIRTVTMRMCASQALSC